MRLVNAHTLEQELLGWAWTEYPDKPEIGDFIEKALHEEPTVDARPNVHGHWIKSEDADDGYCSVCKCDMPMYREDWEWKYIETLYCPNCGAKMQGDNDGNK